MKDLQKRKSAGKRKSYASLKGQRNLIWAVRQNRKDGGKGEIRDVETEIASVESELQEIKKKKLQTEKYSINRK